MKQILLVLALFFSLSGFAQTPITIGNGIAESLYGPIYIFSNSSTNTHSWNLSIYDQPEIVAAGGYSSNLTGISWYKTDTGAYLTPDATFEIYIKHTTLNEFASAADFNIEVAGATPLYSSTTQTLPRAIGWVDFTFNAPFLWNGTDNIMILTRWARIGNGTDEVNWRSTTTTPLTRISHSFNTSSTMGTLYTTPNRPNIKLLLSPQAPDDAGVQSIDSIRGRCPGNVDVYATIRNFGNNAITTCQIDWDIDGVLQTPYIFSGNLLSSDIIQIYLGSTTFTAGVPHSFNVWTSNPNGVADTNNVNDTASVAGLLPGLSGIYSIGPVGADFSTFNSAVSSLVNNGVCGPVEFTVDAGTYTERVIIGDIPNSSAVNNILFRSAINDSSSVTLEWASTFLPDSNYTMLLKGTKYITFQSLTFSRTGTDEYCSVIEMDNGSGDVNFLNNRFIGPTNMTTANVSGFQSGIFNPGNFEWNNLIIRNNLFSGNANGVWLYGLPLDFSENVIIEDNVFDNFYVGVFLLNQYSPVINRNIITRNNVNSTVDYFGISLRYIQGEPRVLKNKITTYTGSYGIRFRESTSVFSNRGVIANNFVQVGDNATGRGISLEEGCMNVDVFHNSVNFEGTNITLGRAFFVDGAGSADLRVINNIFSNSGGGYTSYVSSNATSSLTVSDNNCLYTTGTTLAFFGTAQATLANLQAASSMDANSVNADPTFVSFNDLHTVAGPLGDAGSPLAAIADDIDGDTRELIHPDIGADEFTIVGITDIEGIERLSIYPNPANEILIAEAHSDFIISGLTITDISGREVMRQTLHGKRNAIDVSKLSEGFYLVKMHFSGKTQTTGIVISR